MEFRVSRLDMTILFFVFGFRKASLYPMAIETLNPVALTNANLGFLQGHLVVSQN